MQFGYQWCYAYRTIFGHLSTASPVTFFTGPVIGPPFNFALGGVGTNDPQCSATSTITNIAIAGNILTVTTANTYVAGLSIGFSGLTTATFLNGQTVQILVASPTQFTALLSTRRLCFRPRYRHGNF